MPNTKHINLKKNNQICLVKFSSCQFQNILISTNHGMNFVKTDMGIPQKKN